MSDKQPEEPSDILDPELIRIMEEAMLAEDKAALPQPTKQELLDKIAALSFTDFHPPQDASHMEQTPEQFTIELDRQSLDPASQATLDAMIKRAEDEGRVEVVSDNLRFVVHDMPALMKRVRAIQNKRKKQARNRARGR